MVAAVGSGRRRPSGSPPRSSFGAAFGDIFCAATLVIVPLTVLTAVLLGLIFANLLKPTSSSSATFQAVFNSQFDSDSFYIDFSATQLTTIASWCSSVAPLLSGGVMALFFFQVAALLKRRTEDGRSQELPTPLQLSLLIGYTGGTLGPLSQWLRYMFLQTRETSVSVLRLGTSVLLFSLLWSYLIWAADTWLHVVTTTVVVNQLQDAPSLQSFGRGFSPACENSTTKILDSCVLNPAVTAIFIVNATEGLTLLSNQSTENQIITSTLNDAKLSLITSASIGANTDFSADTFAANVSCKPMTSACKVTAEAGVSTPFDCSDSFQGDLSNAASCSNVTGSPSFGTFLARNLYVTLAYDEQLKHPFAARNATSNPFYFGIAAVMNENVQDLTYLNNDPEIVSPMHGGHAFVLNCEVTLYDMRYTYSNGSVVAASVGRTNTTTANTFVAPLFSGSYTESYVESALRVAALSNSSHDIADKFGLAFGQIVLAGSAGVMVPTRNVEEQVRTQILATRMPKAPLVTLVVANLVYVLFGISLVCFVSAGRPRETYLIKQRLTVEGLAATAFEPASTGPNVESTPELFEESRTPGHSTRVGLRCDDQSGWQFSTGDEVENLGGGRQGGLYEQMY